MTPSYAKVSLRSNGRVQAAPGMRMKMACVPKGKGRFETCPYSSSLLAMR